MTANNDASGHLVSLSDQPGTAGPASGASEENAHQLLLFALPEQTKTADKCVASSQQPRTRRRPAIDPEASKLSPTDVNTSGVARSRVEPVTQTGRIVFVDPFAIEPEPFNGRGLAAFDPDANRELIEDMRIRGNTVPVRLRPNRERTSWTCASGSRRVNSARIIAADQPAFRIAAIIDDAMTNADAYALCLADNHGRSDVTPMQRGREMKWAITHLHGGDRKAYIRRHGVDASVVSRALDLVDLPEPVLACAADRENLPTVFAEKLSPRLKDKTQRKVILARAKALAEERLSAARLLGYLLGGDRQAPPIDRRTIGFGSGRNRVCATVTVAPDGTAVFKVPAAARLGQAERAEMAQFLKAQVDELAAEP